VHWQETDAVHCFAHDLSAVRAVFVLVKLSPHLVSDKAVVDADARPRAEAGESAQRVQCLDGGHT